MNQNNSIITSIEDFIDQLTKNLASKGYDLNEDCKYFTNESIDRLAKRMGNTLFNRKLEGFQFLVKPEIDIEKIEHMFSLGDREILKNLILPECTEERVVKLIRCDKGSLQQINVEITQRGYVNAPLPYLFGLHAQYYKKIKPHAPIIALQEPNPQKDWARHYRFMINYGGYIVYEYELNKSPYCWFIVLDK